MWSDAVRVSGAGSPEVARVDLGSDSRRHRAFRLVPTSFFPATWEDLAWPSGQAPVVDSVAMTRSSAADVSWVVAGHGAKVAGHGAKAPGVLVWSRRRWNPSQPDNGQIRPTELRLPGRRPLTLESPLVALGSGDPVVVATATNELTRGPVFAWTRGPEGRWTASDTGIRTSAGTLGPDRWLPPVTMAMSSGRQVVLAVVTDRRLRLFTPTRPGSPWRELAVGQRIRACAVAGLFFVDGHLVVAWQGGSGSVSCDGEPVRFGAVGGDRLRSADIPALDPDMLDSTFAGRVLSVAVNEDGVLLATGLASPDEGGLRDPPPTVAAVWTRQPGKEWRPVTDPLLSNQLDSVAVSVAVPHGPGFRRWLVMTQPLDALVPQFGHDLVPGAQSWSWRPPKSAS